MPFWTEKKPCTQHLRPFGKIYPSHQASSPAKYLLLVLISQKQQQPLLVLTRIKAAFTPGFLAGSEQQPPSCQPPRSWHRGHVHKIHQVSGRSIHIPENMDIRQRPYKMFQSFLFYPEQDNAVSRPLWTLQPLCSLDTQRGSVQRCSKAQSERWAGSMQLVGQGFLALSPFLNKPRIQCNVKKRKTQVPRCSNSWRQETGINSTPVFLILRYERNQNIYLYTVVHSGVILSTVGKTMQIPLRSTKTYLHFSLKRQSTSEWEKSVLKKL